MSAPSSHPAALSLTADNLRGAGLMVLTMLFFAVEDVLMKAVSKTIPFGQALAILGLGGAALFAVICKKQNVSLFSSDFWHPTVIIRNLGEMIGTLGFVSAIVLTPLSSASAIIQATPLIVALGAALFMGEQIGPRRWVAILIGLFGVLLIVQPGGENFTWLSLLALQGAIGIAIRDLATRRMPRHIHSLQASFWGYLTVPFMGLVLMAVFSQTPAIPSSMDWLLLGGLILTGVLAYYILVASTRIGEVGFVTPFRYSRIIFGFFFGIVFFDERPNLLMIIGAIIVVSSGLYALWREQRAKARRDIA